MKAVARRRSRAEIGDSPLAVRASMSPVLGAIARSAHVGTCPGHVPEALGLDLRTSEVATSALPFEHDIL